MRLTRIRFIINKTRARSSSKRKMDNKLPPSPLQVTKSILKKKRNSASSPMPASSASRAESPMPPSSPLIKSPRRKKTEFSSSTSESGYDTDSKLMSATSARSSTPGSPSKKKKKLQVISPLTGLCII
jgi:hypothetical protein